MIRIGVESSLLAAKLLRAFMSNPNRQWIKNDSEAISARGRRPFVIW